MTPESKAGRAVIWLTALAAVVLAALVIINLVEDLSCGHEAHADTDRAERVARLAAEREKLLSDDWNMEKAIERARSEEAELRTQRAQEAEEAGDEGPIEDRFVLGVIRLQPWFESRPVAASELAWMIEEVAQEYGQSPWIALGIARRESSLSLRVGRGERLGARGEVGYFQIMQHGPDGRRSYAMAQCGRGKNPRSPRANAEIAMCYLKLVRERCESDDPWVYVSAYGMRSCPSARTGRRSTTTKRARQFMCEALNDETECNEIWPL